MKKEKTPIKIRFFSGLESMTWDRARSLPWANEIHIDVAYFNGPELPRLIKHEEMHFKIRALFQNCLPIECAANILWDLWSCTWDKKIFILVLFLVLFAIPVWFVFRLVMWLL